MPPPRTLPHISGRRAVRVLELLGFEVIRRRGSHIVLCRRSSTCVVPDHRGLSTGTLSGIVKQAGITRAEFISALIERAARLAFQIDHPLYDCLYLACAEFTDSALITADKRLADKVGDQLPGVLVCYIGAPATVRRLETGIAAAAGTRIAPSSILRARDAGRK